MGCLARSTYRPAFQAFRTLWLRSRGCAPRWYRSRLRRSLVWLRSSVRGAAPLAGMGRAFGARWCRSRLRRSVFIVEGWLGCLDHGYVFWFDVVAGEGGLTCDFWAVFGVVGWRYFFSCGSETERGGCEGDGGARRGALRRTPSARRGSQDERDVRDVLTQCTQCQDGRGSDGRGLSGCGGAGRGGWA
jgi:hypothetical protein